MVLSTEWSQVEVIDLVNDGNGLGFVLVGGRSTGVVIKALLPGGVAERDGRLQTGDHILQIGDVNLRGFSSEQVAMVLRQTGNHVRLIVARPVEPSSPDYQTLSHAPILPTKVLSDPEELERHLLESSEFPGTFLTTGMMVTTDQIELIEPMLIQSDSMAMVSTSNVRIPPIITTYLDSPETETYEVELRKNVYGLGITVAGYVCEEEDLSGIFVKGIIEGSAAELSGKIQINDRIVAVDGKSLTGVSNHQAVEILRNTDIAVTLTLERFLRGRKFEHLQVALTDTRESNRNSDPQSPSITTLSWLPLKTEIDSFVSQNEEDCVIEQDYASHTTVDSNVFINDNMNDSGDSDQSVSQSTGSCSGDNTPIQEENGISLTENWRKSLPGSEIVVAEVHKLSGLGISLEGTVDVEGGIEKRPHHYIRSILNDGPVGREGSLKPGDELLQVNEHKLQGLTHTNVVKILKELPVEVKMICARGPSSRSVINTSQDPEAFDTRSILPGGHLTLQGLLPKAQSESSLYTSSTATITDHQRSKSVERVSGLALWNSEVIYFEMDKSDKGFGFSILDYQDPMDPEGTVIVVRALIPGGAAENTNLIYPGDRLVSVADYCLEGLSLDAAVKILKNIPPGSVRLGICRPLSTSDNEMSLPETPT